MNGFKKFLFRGNLIDLAVAVVIGVAFNSVVQAIVHDLITPLIGAVGGTPHFQNLTFKVHGSVFMYGDVLNALISFLVVAAVVYYLVVAPAGRVTSFAERNRVASEQECPECLSSIPVNARRCKFCTAPVPPTAAPPPPAGGPERRGSHRLG
jgi:large conductance mechanosensitive channel